MRILNVAEKPSMARQISFLLSGGDVDSVFKEAVQEMGLFTSLDFV